MSNLFNKVINDMQFNFQPFEIGQETGYHLDVKDEHGTRWEFRMVRQDDKWKIEGEKLPDWIPALEPDLGEALDDIS